MTDTNPPADRTAEIRARLAAISPTMSVHVADGDNTLKVTTARSERLGEFTDGVVSVVESLGDVKVRQTGVTIADDEEGQDLTFLLHAPADIAHLLGRVEELERQLGEQQRQLDLTVNQMHQANASALRELQADERAEDLQRQLDAIGEGEEEWAVRVFTRADQSRWFHQWAEAESYEEDLAMTIKSAADGTVMGTDEAPVNHGFAVVKRTVWSSEWETVKTVEATGKPTTARGVRACDHRQCPPSECRGC